ncbi:DUF485 domain-containing protein [Oceanobacillus sp. Castelsardo]|uniref:DUF485 domain-containing protein n=1 Tax=Oceanobacillus sp. Castelsardo TaxID=1851204 RepID=UPI000837EB95|nr:DUF485 domain-containing protein [Oceanobacillus sp. Castelsardo]
MAESHGNNKVDYERIVESEQFKSFMKVKRKFILPMTVFFLVFYFLLPICTSYTTFLNTPAFGDISWVWIFAVAQFVMTWVLCTIYVKKANSFDEKVKAIINDQIEKGGNA